MRMRITLFYWAFVVACVPVLAPAQETQEVIYLQPEAGALAELAGELEDPVSIYEHVRNKYFYEPYFGSRSNSIATFHARRGNDVDLATLLIAMLRSRGYQARYAEGYISIPEDSFLEWLGVEDKGLADTIIESQGIVSPSQSAGGSEPVYDELSGAYEVLHVWVEVLVDVDAYRGATSAASTVCQEELTTNSCRWVALDPSFKRVVHEAEVDLQFEMDDVMPSELFFDKLYGAMLPGNEQFLNKNPMDIYVDLVGEYVSTEAPGAGYSGVLLKPRIIEEVRGLLPLSMPYHVMMKLRSFSSIDERDSAISAEVLPYTRKAKISLAAVDDGMPIFDDVEVPLASLSDKGLVFSYEDCVVTECYLYIKAGETVLVSGVFPLTSVELHEGVRLELEVDPATPLPLIDAAGNETTSIRAVYPEFYVGGVYIISVGGYHSSWGLAHAAIARLLESHAAYPVSLSPADEVYLDINNDGDLDPGELLVDQPQARDALVGGYLEVALQLYYAKFLDHIRELQAIHKLVIPIQALTGASSTAYDVNYIDGSAFMLNPKGLYIDLKGIAISGVYRRGQFNVINNDYLKMFGHLMSSLEHEIWQELTGYDAISTVRGFQYARRDGLTLAESDPVNRAELDQADCYRLSDQILNLLAGLWTTDAAGRKVYIFENIPSTVPGYAPNPDEGYAGATWQGLQDSLDSQEKFINNRFNVLEMVRYVSDGKITPSQSISGLYFCDSVKHSGSLVSVREELHQEALNFPATSIVPDYSLFDFGPADGYYDGGLYIPHPTSASLRNLYDTYDPLIDHFNATTPVISNAVEGGSVYVDMLEMYRYREGYTSTDGGPVLNGVSMHITDRNGVQNAGGGLVLFPEYQNWYELDSSCSTTSILCGGSSGLDMFDRDLFGLGFMYGEGFNGITAPQTEDPVNTVTGSMFHDEKDVHIAGRGLSYVLTRTYNSKESFGSANWTFPLSQGWTHSYNTRLIESDGLKFIDERGATFPYDDVVAATAFTGVGDSSLLPITSDSANYYVLEALGDTDGDTHDDAIYVERTYDSQTLLYTFDVFLLAGDGSGSFTPPALIATFQSSEGFVQILPLGDVNKDDYNDVLVQVPSGPRVFMGSATGLAMTATTFPSVNYAYGGDLNGDGYKELVRFAFSGSYQGVAVYYGGASGYAGATPQIVLNAFYSQAGITDAVRTATDIDGDGFDDLIINSTDLNTSARRAEVYLGSASGLATTPAGAPVFSGAMSSFSNYSYAVGDLNGDGLTDVLSRVPYNEGPAFDVFLNTPNGFVEGSEMRVNLDAYQGSGGLVSPLGDQNGDGYAEFATAFSKEVSPGNSVLHYLIFSGNPGGVQPGPAWEVAVDGTYASLLTGSAFSYPVYLAGEASGILMLTPTELREISLENAQVVDVSATAVCEKEVVQNWQNTGGYLIPFCNGNKYLFSPLKQRRGEVSALLDKILDPYGNELDFAYDAEDRLVSVTDNLGLTGRTGLALTYHSTGPATGMLEAVEDWTGRTWRYEYDSMGRLAAVVPPAGQASKTSYTYVGDKHLLRTITKPEDRDGAQNVVTFDYYENGRAYRYVNGVGDAEVVDYDIFRTSSRITHPGGGVMVHDYNGSGSLEKVVNPDGGIIRYLNTEDNKRYSKKNPLGYETAYSYRQDRSISELASDTNEMVTRERDAIGNTVDYDYGIYSQPTRIKDRRGNERKYVYYDATNAANDAVKGKLHQVLATINGEQDVVLEEYTYFEHGGVKKKVEYIDQDDSTRQRITAFTYLNNGLSVETITISGNTDAAKYGPDAVTKQLSFTYDALGRMETRTIARRTSANNSTLLNLVTTYGYDAAGNLVSETDPAGNVTETVYDKNGKVFQIRFRHKHNDGSYTVHTQKTHYYDAFDRLIRTEDIEAGETRYEYGPTVYGGESDLIAVTDANGNTVRHEYDKMHRRTATIDGNGRRTEFQYDQAGNLLKVINPIGQAVSYDYDPLGRQTLATTHTGEVTEKRYDANGNVTHVLDANAYSDPTARNSLGASIYHEYDEFNRVVRELNAEDGETLYTYDLLGNLTSITDPEGQATRFVYDDIGLLREVIDPIVETPTDLTERYTYDEVGNRLKVIDRKGDVTRFTYDMLNRLTSTEYLTDGTIENRTYDEFGNLESVSNGLVTYTYTYDAKHRVTSRADSRLGLSLAWTYDAVGNVKTKTDYQGSVTTYQYDGGNRLIATSNPDYVHARYAYDGASRITSRTLSNGARTTYSYNNAGRLEKLTNLSANGQIVHEQTFVYDLVGNIESVSDGSNSIIYDYDKMYRLTSADYPGASDDLVYTYDLVGNRETAVTGATTVYYKYSTGNRLEGLYQDAAYTTPIKTYVYDVNGNRTEAIDSDGTTVLQNLAFNQRGFVDTASTPSGGYSFEYDPLGYRIQRTAPSRTNLYMLEGEHLEAIYNPGGAIQSSYHRGSLIDEIVNGFDFSSGTKTNFTVHHDHLNSVTALSDHNGQPWQTYQYDPFGNPLATASPQVPNDFTYTGREWDAVSGLYYYRARYYDPEVGRFVSEDPLGFEAGVNFYAYVANQALIANDPSGLDVYYAEMGGMVAAKLLGTFVDIEPGATVSSILAVETHDSYNPFSWEFDHISNFEAGAGLTMGHSSRSSAELFVGFGMGSEDAILDDLRGAATSLNAQLNVGMAGVLVSQVMPDHQDSYFTSVSLTREFGVGSYSISGGVSRTYGLSTVEGEGFGALDVGEWFNPEPMLDRLSRSYPSTNILAQYFQPAMQPKP